MTGPAVGNDNAARFRQWSLSLHDILSRDYGYSSETITLLYDDGEGDFTGGNRVDGACSREGIELALEQLAERVKTGDQITLYLIGHGSGAEEEAKFNIVGGYDRSAVPSCWTGSISRIWSSLTPPARALVFVFAVQ